MKEGSNLSYTVRDQFKVQEGKQISNQCKGKFFFLFFFSILFLNNYTLTEVAKYYE